MGSTGAAPFMYPLRAMDRMAPSPPCQDTPRAFDPPGWSKPRSPFAAPLSRFRPVRLLPFRVLPPGPPMAPPGNIAPACADPPNVAAPPGVK